MPHPARVALLAGDLGSAAVLAAAQTLAASKSWDAVHAIQDAAQPSIGQQVLRISRDPQGAAAALASCREVSHLFFISAAAAGGCPLAAQLDEFQRLVSAARDAGCQLQQAHFSALTSLQHPPGRDDSAVDIAHLKALSGCTSPRTSGAIAAKHRAEAAMPLSSPGAPSPLLRAPGAFAEVWTRGRWLLGLLVLQSASSAVLDAYQDLLARHLVVTFFLTMLVGAGGNAGNQSAIKVIRGLAVGKYRATGTSMRRVVLGQLAIALLLGAVLSVGGLARVYATSGRLRDSAAIAGSLFLIVLASVLLGTLLPFLLARAGHDPAHAGSSIQVLMDVLGVLITCVVCTLVLDPGVRPSLRHPAALPTVEQVVLQTARGA